MSDLAVQVRMLRERLEERDEIIRQLRGQLCPVTPFPLALGLTPGEEKVLSVLLARSPSLRTKEQILFAVYPRIDDAPAIKIVDVWVHKLRVKLKRFDIKIRTVWGQGYQIEADAAAALRAAIAAPPLLSPIAPERFTDIPPPSDPRPGTRAAHQSLMKEKRRVILADWYDRVPVYQTARKVNLAECTIHNHRREMLRAIVPHLLERPPA